MTRKSKREIERDLESLQDDVDHPDGTVIVIHDTVVGTDNEDSDLAPGETVETTKRIEL